MVYIDFLENEEELSFYSLRKYWKIVNKVRLMYYKVFRKVISTSLEDKTVVLLPKLDSRSFKKLEQKLLQMNSKTVCLSKKLEKNDILKNFLNEKNKDILDGKWLFSYLVEHILAYIEKQTEENILEQEIAILTNEIDEKIAGWIIKLACKYKRIELITKEPLKFKKLEEHLYNEYGIELNITYNERKSLKNAGIVLNFNFVEEALNKFSISKNAIIINFEQEIAIENRSFNGIIVNGYHIHLPTNYFKYVIPFQKFSSNLIYESLIYKKTNFNNVLKQISDDNVELHYLIGIRGKIKNQEFKRRKKLLTN